MNPSLDLVRKARQWINALPAKLWPRHYRPMMDVLIDVGFASVRTVLMRDSDYRRVIDYIGLECRLLKWGVTLRLYDTMERRYDRG